MKYVFGWGHSFPTTFRDAGGGMNIKMPKCVIGVDVHGGHFKDALKDGGLCEMMV
jgi:hypothetical protein